METMIHDDLKYVCVECGYINFQLISISGECNDFSNGKSEGITTRYGLINSLLPQSSRATTMLSYYGKGGKSYLARMHEWYNMPYNEKSLLEIFHLIDRKCIKDNLPTIIRDRSKLMFKILKDENILKREKPKHALIASCIYYACKEKGIPKTTKELAKLFDISITQMTTGCKQFNEIMYYNNLDFLITIKPITYIECINSICHMLDIEDRYKSIIINIAKVADRIGIVNDNIPPSIAVSAIYFFIVMMDLPITKKTLSMRSNISEVTISKTYKKLYPYRKYLLTMKCL
jgi:transcription initiation factor TFIIB